MTKKGDKFVIELDGKFPAFDAFSNGRVCHVYTIAGVTDFLIPDTVVDKLDRIDSDWIMDNFPELEKKAYEEGVKYGKQIAFRDMLPKENLDEILEQMGYVKGLPCYKCKYFECEKEWIDQEWLWCKLFAKHVGELDHCSWGEQK